MSSASLVTECLIIFTRYPVPGQAKTRLIPALKAWGAADLHRQMTEHTLAQVRQFRATNPLSIEVHYAGSRDHNRMADWLGADLVYQLQSGADLGERMVQSLRSVFDSSLQSGHDRHPGAIIIGTDCPGINPALLKLAFEHLHSADLVLGPAIDGGYYLIGLSRLIPELFVGINWSTVEVLRQTVEIANQLGLKVAYLPSLADIDRPEDLPVWEEINSIDDPPKISVIIPTLNEAANIQRAISSINPNRHVEVIIVDGGSSDGTMEIAQKLNSVKVLSVIGGRAVQMNLGATVATGEILLFLHADTLLPAGFATMVRTALSENNDLAPIAGAFALRIDSPQQRFRLIEWGVNWRSRFAKMPYGDQAIFLTAQTFAQVGGFPELPIMEDFQLIRQLGRLGRIEIVAIPVVTSARRWLKLGIVQTTLINQMMILAYFWGVSPTQLSRWYRSSQHPLRQ